MTRSKFKWAGILTVAGVVASSLVGGATPAQAQAKSSICNATSISPSTINLGVSSVVQKFAVTAAECPTPLADWSIQVDPLYLIAFQSAPSQIIDPSDYTDSQAGTYRAEVDTYDSNYTPYVAYLPFTLKRYDTWGNTFNASPEPVKKGATVNFSGELLRANWDQGKYYGYGKGYTHLDFRPAGNPTWATVKTFHTSATSPGHISGLTAKATVSGFWRVYYTGNAYGSPAYSTSDYVGVD